MTATTTPIKSKCRYCREGSHPKADGTHWIVKSIFPAKIKIVQCKNFDQRLRSAMRDTP